MVDTPFLLLNYTHTHTHIYIYIYIYEKWLFLLTGVHFEDHNKLLCLLSAVTTSLYYFIRATDFCKQTTNMIFMISGSMIVGNRD